MTGSCLAELATIAWEVYILCRDAPEEFQSVAEGIVALHTSATLLELQNVHNLAQDRICPLARDSQQSLCAIQAIINRTSCHAYRERDSRMILLRERSEQLIRITILFSAASAAITNSVNDIEACQKLNAILSPIRDAPSNSKLVPEDIYPRPMTQEMPSTPKKRATIKRALRGLSTRISGSKHSHTSRDIVFLSPRDSQLSANAHEPRTIYLPSKRYSTEPYSLCSPSDNLSNSVDLAEPLPVNATMIETSSGGVMRNGGSRPKSEAHSKVKKPVPIRLSQPEVVTRLHSLSEDLAFIPTLSRFFLDRPACQGQSSGPESSASSQGKERASWISTRLASKRSEHAPWVRESYESSTDQPTSYTSLASSSWNSREKETFEKHEAIMKSLYFGRTAEQEAKMESTRRSLQIRATSGFIVPPPPFHRLGGMEIALPCRNSQTGTETKQHRRHTQPAVCHVSNPLSDHGSPQHDRELLERGKAVVNSIECLRAPENTRPSLILKTSNLENLQSTMKDNEISVDAKKLGNNSCSLLLVGLARDWAEAGSLTNLDTNISSLTDTLCTAVANNDLATVKGILENVPSASIPGFWESTALYTAARFGYLDLARVLVQHGAMADYQGKEGKSPLHIAARNGTTGFFNLLLDLNAQLNWGGYSIAANRTPLDEAAIGGHVNALELLFERGRYLPSDVDQALMYAAKYGHIPAIQYLIKRGATINPPSGHRAPLHEACCTGGLAAVEFLLNQGALVDRVDQRGRAPLHDAAAHFEPEIVKVLLRAGGPEYRAMKDESDRTPLDLARRFEDNEGVIKILEEYIVY